MKIRTTRHGDPEVAPNTRPIARLARRRSVPLAIIILLSLGVLWLASAFRTSDPVAAAWSRARAAGTYRFAGDIVQVTTPTSTLENVGRTSHSDQLHLEGQVKVREQQAEMQLWTQDGSVLNTQSGVGVRVADGKTYVREGAGAWQERAGFSHAYAPQGDVMAYLTAARDVVAHASESRAGVTFSRLTFRLDGPAFGAYMRDQAEQALRQREAVPAGMQFDIPAYYRDMVGGGELWVGQDGLPIRQILTLDFPEQGGESTSSQVTMTFSNFGLPESGISSVLLKASAILPDLLPGLVLLVLTLAFVWALTRFGRSRVVGAALAVVLIASLVWEPLLRSLKISNVLEAQAAQAASQEENRAVQQQALALKDRLAAPSFDPHANPLAAVAGSQDSPMGPSLDQASYVQPAAVDNGKDTDKDGLTDYQEQRVGTDTTFGDTDEDGVGDAVEAKGVQFGGKTWYLDPNTIDSNNDGIGDGQEWDNDDNKVADDTDGDGTPDIFDGDNDGDGVPDTKDLSPFTHTSTFQEANPFTLKVNNLVAGKPTFVDFQLRPSNEKHLWFAIDVLDWPGDRGGQIRDIDNLTYADVAHSQGRTPGANEAFGDMKLIPMLEIRIPANSANLPQQSDLTPYNISVNNFTSDGATKIAYVPLSLVTDEKSGMRVAFSGRMRYQSTGSWPEAHQVRLAWVVQTLVDMPCSRNAPDAAQRGCGPDGYIRNVPQIVQAYYDDWMLAGLNVKEDNGTGVAIAYEDPAVDANLKEDGPLTALSAGLDNAFLTGRDSDKDGKRDIDLAEIVRRFNRTSNSAVSEDQRWAIPNILRVERKNYATFDQALSSTAMTETVRILNTRFATPWANDKAIKPLILYAQEARARAIGLDGLKAGGYAALSGNALTIEFRPNGKPKAPLITTNYLNWTPFCAAGAAPPTWSPCDTETWWNELERRSPVSDILPGDDPNNTNLAAGRVLVMNIYSTQLITGISRVVEEDNTLVSGSYSLKDDPTYASLVRVAFAGVNAVVKNIADVVIMARFVNNVKVLEELGNTFKAIRGGSAGDMARSVASIFRNAKVGGLVNRAAATGLVLGGAVLLAGILTVLYYNFLTTELGGKIAFKVLVIGIMTVASVISPLLTIKEWAGALKAAGSTTSALTLSNEVSGTTKAAGVIGTLIAVAVTWGFFIYSMVSNKVSAFSPEFNRALAETIATTIYIVLLFVLSATLIGAVLVGIIGIIDAILTAICELGVDALRTVPGLGGSCFTLGNAAIKGLAYSLYNYSPMIDTSRAELLVTGSPDVKFADPSKGFMAGNRLSVSMPVTTTIVHKDPDPKDGVLIYPYMWLYSQDNLRSSTFKYTLTSSSETVSVERDQMKDSWKDVREDHKYLLSPMYRGQAATTPAPITGISLAAGLNQKIPITLNMGYAIPAYECWGLLILGVCYTRELADSNSTVLDPLTFDIFPASLDDFMALTAKYGGAGLAWSPEFTALKDADGDGLETMAQTGIDPDDTTPDADGDGLADGYELDLRTHSTGYDERRCDTDGDGLTDGQEAQLGSNPAIRRQRQG